MTYSNDICILISHSTRKARTAIIAALKVVGVEYTYTSLSESKATREEYPYARFHVTMTDEEAKAFDVALDAAEEIAGIKDTQAVEIYSS